MLEYRQVDLAANANAELMSTDVTTGFASKLRTLNFPSMVGLLLIATSAEVQFRVTIGPDLVVPTSPMTSGGTIGVFPRPDEVSPLIFEGLPGDEISVELVNTAGNTPSVMAIVDVVPQ